MKHDTLMILLGLASGCVASLPHRSYRFRKHPRGYARWRKELLGGVVLALGVLSLGQPAIAAPGLQPSAPPALGWKKITIAERTFYVAATGEVSCVVEAEPDGDILVHATDPDWHGEIVTHDARVHSGYVDSSTTVLKSSGERDPLDAGYMVFTSKCTDLAQKLPTEVIVKFKGAFGLR